MVKCKPAVGAASLAGRVEMVGDVRRHGPNPSGLRWSDDAATDAVFAAAAAAAAAPGTSGTSGGRRDAVLAGLAPLARWTPTRNHPRGGGNTIADRINNHDLTVS